MAKPKPKRTTTVPVNTTTRTTNTTRTTARDPGAYPANPYAHVRLPPPPQPIPLPYAHPVRTAGDLVDQQLQAALTALPTQETVGAPYLHQQDALTQLTQSLQQHLQQASNYRNDLAAGMQGAAGQQGAAAAQSIGGASPEASGNAAADAATLGGYGSSAADAVAAELGSTPGYTAQYQARIAQAMQQALQTSIEQPRQQILAQRPSLLQTIFDRLQTANTQTQAQNQSAAAQASDIALRAAQLGVSGYNAATSRGNYTTPTTVTTGNTTQTQNPGQDQRDAAARDRDLVTRRTKVSTFLENRADALFKQHSTSTTSDKPGYYVYYHYQQPGLNGVVDHTGRVWVDEAHAQQAKIHASQPGWLTSHLGLPAGAVKTGNIQPVGAGTNITTYSGQGYGDALSNIQNYLESLNRQLGTGYTDAEIHQLAQNAVNARWVPGNRGRPNAGSGGRTTTPNDHHHPNG